MSLKQKKDVMILFSLIVIPVFLVAAFYQYVISQDSLFLYIGIATLLLIISVVFVRRRDILNYVRAFLKEWT
jgi:hypothetical protein